MRQDFLNNKKEGYTLLEVAVSIMIFAIITLGLSLPFSNSISLTVDDKNINAASNLARSYLEDTEKSWNTQNSFDKGNLINIGNNYTNNGKYTATVNAVDISTDTSGIVLVRRLNINYKDSRGKTLVNIFYEYSRPNS